MLLEAAKQLRMERALPFTTDGIVKRGWIAHNSLRFEVGLLEFKSEARRSYSYAGGSPMATPATDIPPSHTMMAPVT